MFRCCTVRIRIVLIFNLCRIVEAFKWAYAVRTRLGDPADPDIRDEVNQVRTI